MKHIVDIPESYNHATDVKITASKDEKMLFIVASDRMPMVYDMETKKWSFVTLSNAGEAEWLNPIEYAQKYGKPQ